MPPRNLTYREIADDLAARIRAGEVGYKPGDQLLSLTRLAALYSVSVSTASRAMGLLHDRGLVESVVGRGVFVRLSDQ
jgi:GntR family transcriptional regulator